MFNLTQYGFQHHRMVMPHKHECIHTHNIPKMFSYLNLITTLLGISPYHQSRIKGSQSVNYSLLKMPAINHYH